jgi:hypothetical protein
MNHVPDVVPGTRKVLLDENIRKRKSAGKQHYYALTYPRDFL